MHVLLIVLGLLGGFAAPTTLAAITPLQWVLVAGGLQGASQDALQLAGAAKAISETPAFRAWVAANAERATRLQPGITTFNGVAY